MIALEPPARWFASDNAAGAHPLVLQSIVSANEGHALAYGSDPLTSQAEIDFCALFDADVVTRFVYGGTGANVFGLACMLDKGDAVVCSNWAHIAVDEAGAPEHILGAKLIQVNTLDAKIRPKDVLSLSPLRNSQHHAPPGVLSITQATELGTLYTASEVRDLCEAAHEMGMTVHMDGARIANATAALGGDRSALRSFTIDAGVDVLTFGGTKAGAIFGEAVVFLNTSLARRSLNVRKQSTQLHSKMRFISAQYRALLADDLFIDLGRRANMAALRLWQRTRDIASLGLDGEPAVNSIFPILAQPHRRMLQDWSFFWDWDVSRDQVRWMTSWDTTDHDVDLFVAGVRQVVED
jgi:threonine aldolase